MNIDIEQLRKMRADGVPNADIMAHFGCSKSYLESIVKEHKLPPKPYRWPAIDMVKMRAEWMAGTTTRDPAKMFGVSTTRIRETARAAGLPQRAHGGRRGGMAPIPPRRDLPRPTVQLRAVPYAEVNALADANGWTIQRAQQEIHRQRAGRV